MTQRQRHQVFDSFVTTVGSNGTMTLPLRDATNAGITTLHVGPLYRRNPVRFFAKMPTLEEATRLPCPLKNDRNSITFDPLFVYLGGPLPPHCTVEFGRVMSGKNRGKMNKKPVHRWNPLEETVIYPAATIQIATLRPSETIELEGVSWWYNAKPPRAGQRNHSFMYPLPAEPPPQTRSMHPVQLMLLVRLKWLPKESSRKQFRVVKGSPLDHTAPSMPLNPEAPAPEIPQPAQDSEPSSDY